MHGRGRSCGGRAEGRAQLYHRRLGIPGAGNQGIVNELRRTLTIVNQRGLHARASAKFVNAVSQLPDGTRVRVAKDGNEAEGGSILGLMMLGAAKGDSIDLIVAGTNAEAVLGDLASMIDDGFGEE